MCSLERLGKVMILRLVGDTEHRFSPSLCSQIQAALSSVAESDARALVTTNDGKFYSNGLDLEWLQGQPQTRGPSLLRHLEQIVLALMKLNIPTYAAICGHAAAGGLLFAMAHDHRFMRKDRGFLYSSAVDINFVLPPASAALMRSKMTPKVFKDVVLQGLKYTGIMALQAGLIDSLHDDPAQTFEEALKEASSFADRPWEKPVYRSLRLAMYPEVIQKLEAEVADESSTVGFFHTL